MTKPTSRSELKEYGLRRLGKPVITINVDDDQVDDAVDDALDFLQDYHNEFTQRTYVAHAITQNDIDNEYIVLPALTKNVHSVINFMNNADGGDSLFSVKYQLRLNDLFNLTSATMEYYYIGRQYISLLDDLLNPEIRFEYNQYDGRKLYLNLKWADEFSVGSYVLIEIEKLVDMTTATGLWGHRLLRDVFTEMLRIRWGDNLSKFGGLQLPGGVTLEGPQVVQEGRDRLAQITENFREKYSTPVDFLIE